MAAVLIWFYPGIGILTLVILLSIGFVMLSITSLPVGASEPHLPGWLRAVHINLGVIVLVIAAVPILFPAFGAALLVTFLALALMLDGVVHPAAGGGGTGQAGIGVSAPPRGSS